MKLKRHIILIIIVVSCFEVLAAFYNYFASPVQQTPYRIPIRPTDTIRVAYIGDSWAAMHAQHACIIQKLIEDKMQRPVKLSSLGFHGKTSKEIYEYLFNKQEMKDFMMQGYDFCFISAGINDTYKKMSVNYYTQSMDYIVQFMLTNKIHSIILEIPDYDIQKTYNRQKESRKMLRRLSMIITGNKIDCKQFFRSALQETIGNDVTIIHYKEWNDNYKEDLKNLYTNDGMHLNQQGYARLDSCIATHILRILNSKPNALN